MIDRADRHSVDRNPDAQAARLLLRRSHPTKLQSYPRAPRYRTRLLLIRQALMLISLSVLSVSDETSSHCLDCPVIIQASLRANPLLACVLVFVLGCVACSLLQISLCHCHLSLPQTRQNRAECIAVQRSADIGWTLKAASSRPCRVRPAELAIASTCVSGDISEIQILRNPTQRRPSHRRMHATQSSFWTHPFSPAERRHGGAARPFARPNKQI